jgi:hypothetical protein
VRARGAREPRVNPCQAAKRQAAPCEPPCLQSQSVAPSSVFGRGPYRPFSPFLKRSCPPHFAVWTRLVPRFRPSKSWRRGRVGDGIGGSFNGGRVQAQSMMRLLTVLDAGSRCPPRSHMLTGKKKGSAMRTVRARRFWRIEGYDRARRVFEKTLAFGALSEPQMVVLLQRLASRHLGDNEIIASSLRRNVSGCASHLEHRVGSRATGEKRYTISVGLDPHYVASVWQNDELAGSEGTS